MSIARARWTGILFLLCTLGAFCAGTSIAEQNPALEIRSSSPQSSAFRITGVVVSELGGAAVPGCHLSGHLSDGNGTQRGQRQRSSGNLDHPPSAETDASGHFTLLLPSGGTWQLEASARGFRRQAYDRHENFFTAIVLTRGAPAYDLVFKLEPDSSIAGFVRDEAGESVRNARVSLSVAESPNSDPAESSPAPQAFTVTDDRGHYEVAELAPGEYVVSVQGAPWYAANPQGRRVSGGTAAAADASLDVVYAETWFPGVTDRHSAGSLSLHHGEVQQADFDLLPMPAAHLEINVSQASTLAGVRDQTTPQVDRVGRGGFPSLNNSTQIDSQGQINIGGLSPGLYRISFPGPNGSQAPSFLRVPNGAQHTFDLTSAATVAAITFSSDARIESSRMQIILTDVDTGDRFSSFADGDFPRRRSVTAGSTTAAGDWRLEVPPGRYRVTISGGEDIYLGGITGGKEPREGRIITLSSGSTNLGLNLKRGRSNLRGIVSAAGKPLAGAMVMLVPATFGGPGSITILRRDQTNTDGGYLIENIIPGDYILIAIDGGWAVNLHDPSTLQRYLLHGVALDLKPLAKVSQDLPSQAP